MKIIRIEQSQCELVVKLFNDYRIFYKQPSDIDLARAFLQQRLKNNESVVFVAIDSDVAIGFTQLYPKFSSMRAIRDWVLNDLFVDPKFRKKGIGEKLIQEAIAFARLDGATFVDLSTAVDNYTAQSLYERIGFIRKGNDSEFYAYRKKLSKAE